MNSFFVGVIFIILGYLTGSLSSAYFLGKIFFRVDLRERGSKKLGVSNVYRELGIFPAVLTAIFDLSKGAAIILLALIFGAPAIFAYAAGAAAIIGHIFPFYLSFRGGHGVATAAGELFYYLFLVVKHGWISFLGFLVLLFLFLVFLYISKRKSSIAIFVAFPIFLIFVFLKAPPNLIALFLAITTLFIWYFSARNFYEKSLKTLPRQTFLEIKSWRTIMRPAAIALPIIYFYTDKKSVLLLVGILALIFLLVDLFRFLFRGLNVYLVKSLFIKPKELHVFSSMTFFLLATFLTFLIFEKSIAAAAVLFLIFGDFFAKIFGLIFGRIKIFTKTLEGSMAHFSICLVFGYVLTFFAPVPFLTVLIGAFVATFIEILPLPMDDNFSVSLISGLAMYSAKFFA